MGSGLSITANVHVARGTQPLAHRAALPPAPTTDQFTLPLVDRIGESAATHPLLLAGGAAGSALAGTLLARTVLKGIAPHTFHGGLLRGAAIGAATLLGTAAVAIGASWLGHRDDHAAVVTAAPDPTTAIAASEQLKVMTYNVRGGTGPHGFGSDQQKLHALADEIRAEHPDVVVLQELDSAATRSTWHDTLDALAAELHPDSAVAVGTGRLVTGRSQDVGVMTFNGTTVEDARGMEVADPAGSGLWRRIRGSLHDIGQALPDRPDLPGQLPTYAPGVALDTMVRTAAGNDVRVLTMHVGTDPRDDADLRLLQEGALAQLAGTWQGPTILGGDFNTTAGSAEGERERKLFGDAGLTDGFLQSGVPIADHESRASSPNDRHDIDRIYTGGGVTAADEHVVHVAGTEASDHRPVVATVTLTPARA